MRHIFVSYCHNDSDFAEILEGKIREWGFLTWRDRSLHAGDNWRKEIDRGLKDAMAVVAVMSPQARNSPYVTYEWSFAIGSGVPIVPVLLRLPAMDLHPRLNEYQALDFSNTPARPWEQLEESLRNLAEAEREFTLRVPRDAPPVVREAARTLDDMDRTRRLAAIASLADMTHPAALDLLAEAVHHPIREVRFGAAFQLGGKLHDARALPALMEALNNGDRNVEPWMVSNIGQGAVGAVVEALRDRGFRRRDDLFIILGNIRGAAAVEALIGYLKSPDSRDRRDAAFALSAAGDGAALPALREIAGDPDPQVRRGVAGALGKCGGAAAVDDLLGMLRDRTSDVRHEAAVSLGKLCEERPVPAALEPAIPRLLDGLIGALDDDYDQVRAFTTMAVKNLNDTRAIPLLIAALGRNPKYSSTGNALHLFAETAVPAMRPVLHDGNQRLRMAAIDLVARYGDLEDADAIAGVLHDTNPDARLRAIGTIGSRLSESPLIAQALVECLQDPEEDVAIAAIEALGRFHLASTVPRLIECLKVEALASSAADALQWFDTREVRSALKAWNKSKKQSGGNDGLER
jgi:HEAT repeat protein